MLTDFLFNGGTFPVNQLTKNQKALYKNYKRNKAIPKSAYPVYKTNRIISKAAKGEVLNFAKYNPIIPDVPDVSFSPNKSIEEIVKQVNQASGLSYDPLDAVMSLSDIQSELQSTAQPTQFTGTSINSTSSTPLGFTAFNTAFDRVVAKRPEAEKYRKVLTNLAEAESSFRPQAKNPNYEAYGYFQMIKDGKHDNVSLGKKYSDNPDTFGLSEFLQNPEVQINAAIDLAKHFESQLTAEDKKLAQQQGYSMDSLIAGSWLGGVGGVRKVLKGQGNPSDRSHSPKGQGSDVKTYMTKFK